MNAVEVDSLATMSDLIGRIYDCALDPGLWPDVLSEIGKRLRFCQITLTLQSMPAGTVMLSVGSGVPEPWLARSTTYGAEVIEMWGGFDRIAATPLEEPVLLSEMNPGLLDGSVDNAFHREWYRPQRLLDTAGVALARDATTLASISFTRHDDEGAIGEVEAELIRLLAPHLRRAVTISRLLDARAVEAATFETVIERTIAPILIIDAQLKIVHANGAARALLERGTPLVRSGDRLITSQPAATRALAVAVAQAVEDETQIGRRGLGIPLLQDDGQPYVLHVLPLSGGTLRPDLMSRAAAAIFVGSTVPKLAAAGSLAAQLFGLSGGETRVFDLIAEGLTPAETASRLGIYTSTVRTHLLRIYEKTGTSRQTEVVRLAAGLAPPAS